MEFTIGKVREILNRLYSTENLWNVKLVEKERMAFDGKGTINQGFHAITLQHDDGAVKVYEVPETDKFLKKVSAEYDRLRKLNDGYKSSEEEDQECAVDNVLSQYEIFSELLWG